MNLVVDVGSALGLWLGSSGLSLNIIPLKIQVLLGPMDLEKQLNV